MKKFLSTIILLSMSLYILIAQSPKAFKYQAVARDEAGNIISNTDVSIRIKILEGLISETNVYTETHDIRVNAHGLINLIIGEGNVESGNMDIIDWGNNNYLLQIEIADTGATYYQILGKAQLVSVPYALYADKAGNVFSGDYNDLINTPDLNSDTTWHRFTNDIYYSNGDVGIGTTFPKSRLQIKGGDVYIEDINQGLVLKSPDSSCWRLTVENDGSITTTSIECAENIVDTAGLLGYWPFNGNANNEVGAFGNGTVHGAQLTEDRFGNPNSAYFFDGIDDYISIPDDEHFDNFENISISAWIKPDTFNTNRAIISKGDSDLDLSQINMLFSGNRASAHIYGTGDGTDFVSIYSGSYYDFRWYHIVYTYSSVDGPKLYFDGSLVNFSPDLLASGTTAGNDLSLMIGCNVRSENIRSNYYGIIDDVRIYNTVLSLTEIIALFNETP